MRIRRQKNVGLCGNRDLCVILLCLAAFAFACGVAVMPLDAQASRQGQQSLASGGAGSAQAGAMQSPAANSKMPEWQVAAGGHKEFDVASVKLDPSELGPQTTHSNVPLGPMDSFSPTGGLLQATNYPLYVYIIFAYKPTSTQMQSIQSQLPKWATTNHYDIVARVSGNPTKDQFRLMMQSLLADRFKLAVHYETKQTPVLALVMDKPGKLGPHLQLHSADAPCSTANTGGDATVARGFPVQCGVIVPRTLSSPEAAATGLLSVGARNVSIVMLANIISSQPMININKPVVDKTGIEGNVDFVIEFSPDVPPGLGFTPDPNGPTFLEAIKDQLGLKLEQQTGPVDSITIDHIEQPSEN